MKPKRLLSLGLVGVLLVVVGATAGGCGGGSDAGADSGQSYDEVLHGLKRAALSDRAYDAVRRAKGLNPGEWPVLREFCKFAWQMGAYHEAWKLGKVRWAINRIRGNAADGLNDVYLTALDTAMKKLEAAVHPATFDVGSMKRYTKACYG
ncbi:MAG TPA: hypothetical protein VFM94_02080 [Solirubrobacterales bacterium]|nr:hypothetical protein [Solirubrobacterales bacterium]